MDGTNSSLNFQLGVDAVDQLNVLLESSKTLILVWQLVWELNYLQVQELSW